VLAALPVAFVTGTSLADFRLSKFGGVFVLLAFLPLIALLFSENSSFTFFSFRMHVWELRFGGTVAV
jgi:hypothetical protein